MRTVNVFSLILLSTFLQGEKDKKIEKTKKLSSKSIWRPFDCRTNSDCPASKYCLGWTCVLRHKGFCSHDRQCLGQEWCNIQHRCVRKSWCDVDAECGTNKCCAKVDHLTQGKCLPLIKHGGICLIKIMLCPCVKECYCKALSERLGRCTKADRNMSTELASNGMNGPTEINNNT
ncbi:uncharacterized protein LOC114522044 [Dendronephthya gigantea]|uniref:uncharacterized protein LOC114522044 n=1 Tax=Dendronephthya gigantea TaxID=151771 RepID=UPI00106A3A07|nr:uncharacterized protein LOC114522044 [Dendronephthya gigantea]